MNAANLITEIELTTPRNKRWVAVDQAIELARMIPEGDPIRAKLLKAAASSWMMHSDVIAILTETDTTEKETI